MKKAQVQQAIEMLHSQMTASAMRHSVAAGSALTETERQFESGQAQAFFSASGALSDLIDRFSGK